MTNRAPAFIVAVFLAGTVPPLAAQEPADTVRVPADAAREPADAAREPSHTVAGPNTPIELPELVVTAARLTLPRAAVPSAVTVITGAELEARGVRTVEDALRSVPGATVARTGSFGAMTSLSIRGGETNYVRVLVDGVPVNQPGGGYDFAHLTTDNVDRIEVVRSAASVLYGSDAMTGVVQLFTRQGAGDPRATVSLQGGSYGSAHLRASLAGGAETASYAFGVSRFSTDGVHEVNNEYRNTVLSGRVQVRPDDRTDATLAVRYSDNQFHFPTDGAGRLVRDGVRHEDVVTLSFDAGRFLTDRLEGRLLLTVNEVGGGFDDRPLDPDAAGYFAFWSVENVARRGLDARANLHAGEGAVFTLGASAERQRERSFRESRSEWGDDVDFMDVERWTTGGYAQVIAAPAARLSLTGGARLERNEEFGTFATYRAGATYRLGSETRLRAAIGTGFKEPTFFENFASGFVRGNPDLDPESSRSWEAGIERTLAGRAVRVGLTYFDQRFRDMIQYSPQPFGSDEPNYFNIAAAESEGLELETTLTATEAWPLPRGAWLRANYTWMQTRVTDAGFQGEPGDVFVEGQRLVRRPEHSANLVLGVRPGAGTGLSVSLNLVGERDDLDFSDWPAERVVLPAYTRVDLAADATVLRGGGGLPPIALIARVENLFDATYEEVRNYPARGRAVFVGTRLDF